MFPKGMIKSEIEKALSTQGDYVQIDNLTRLLQNSPPLDVKKFAHIRLAEIYERRKMFYEAARMWDTLAQMTSDKAEKIKNYAKSTELLIRGGFLDRADLLVKKLMSEEIPASQKAEIQFNVKNAYKKQAEEYEKTRKLGNALKIYEKLLTLNISDQEKLEINKKLLVLYNTLGKIKEYLILKKKFEERRF
jgi:tetratricopeptide (TPR) repeat protein